MISPTDALAFRSPEDQTMLAHWEEQIDAKLKAFHGQPVRIEMPNLPAKVALDLAEKYGAVWSIQQDPVDQLSGPAAWTFSAKDREAS